MPFSHYKTNITWPLLASFFFITNDLRWANLNLEKDTNLAAKQFIFFSDSEVL